jgi:two-component system response regulator YesN
LAGALIVDDEVESRQEIRLIIEGSQYNYLSVYEASSAERALFSLKQNQPDIVMLDLSLPDMDGIRLGKKIKELHPQICIIVVSHIKMFETVQMAMNAGFSKYYLKPLVNIELISVLDQIFLPNLMKDTNYFGKTAVTSKPSEFDLGNPIQSVIGYIHGHYYDQVSLNEVAGWVYLSASHFSRLFKAEMGVTYIEYLTKYRIEQSKRLIKMTNLPIEVIANNTGFMHAGYFATTFKRLEGKTPSEYRSMLAKFIHK